MRNPTLLLLLLTTAAACHSFQPVEVGEITPGQNLRVRVTGAYSDSLAPILLRDARVVEGRVVERDSGRVLMEVPVESGFEGIRFQSLNQRVEVPDSEMLEVEVKELSRGRTLAVTGIAGAIVAAIVIAELNSETGGGQRPGTGGPQDAVVAAPGMRVSTTGLLRFLGVLR